MTLKSELGRAALRLAGKGLAVFPCRPRDKRPATATGLKDATTDLDVIRQWWRREPQFNLAIATGAVSGIFVVDIDGLDAEVELRRLEASTVDFRVSRSHHGARPTCLFSLAGNSGAQFGQQGRTWDRRARRWRLRPGAAIHSSERAAIRVVSRLCNCACSRPRVANRQDLDTGHRRHTSAAARGLARACRERCGGRHTRLHDREAGRSPVAPPDRSVRRARASTNMECNKMRASAAASRHRTHCRFDCGQGNSAETRSCITPVDRIGWMIA